MNLLRKALAAIAQKSKTKTKTKAMPRSVVLMPTDRVRTVIHKGGKKVLIRDWDWVDFSRYPGHRLREIRKTHR